MRRAVCVGLLIALFTGTSCVSDKDMNDWSQHSEVELPAVSYGFYAARGRWPLSKGELSSWASSAGKRFDASWYGDMAFLPQPNGDLVVQWSRPGSNAFNRDFQQVRLPRPTRARR